MGNNFFDRLNELEYTPSWKEFLVILKKVVGDGFGIWLPLDRLSEEEYNAKWIEFKADLNNDNELK